MTITGKQANKVLCRHCGKVSDFSSSASSAEVSNASCSRCGSGLEQRIHHSQQKTWAFLLASIVAFIPANVYPVMTVVMFGRGHPDTIMSGVVTLMQANMYPIAAVVFIASILVPVFKLLGLLTLLLAIRFRWPINHRQATVMYRYVHFIGRWSMLDLFMISILVTLVNMGGVAAIHTGTGATAFAGVVVLTMLAASAFDPRLIWDLVDDNDRQ